MYLKSRPRKEGCCNKGNRGFQKAHNYADFISVWLSSVFYG